MERTVLLVRREQRSKLTHIATREKISVAEANRRAIDAYNPFDVDITDMKELEKLADFLVASTKKASKALKDAQKEMQVTLAYFAHKKKPIKRKTGK